MSAEPMQSVGPIAEPAPINSIGLLAQLHEDYIAHGKGVTRPGLHAVWVYRVGSRINRLPKIPRAILKIFYLPVFWFVRNFYGIEVPADATIGRRFAIGHQSGIVLHGDVVIGDDVTIRHNVTIGARGGDRHGVPVLGNKIDVGCGACILGAIRVGNNANIGANSVVLNDVPDGATAVGIPARIIPGKSKN